MNVRPRTGLRHPPTATWEHRRCPDCKRDTYRVGPFLICRNLTCRTLVVGVFR